MYAVAITVEDFPRSNISIGGTTYTPNDPMTSVNLQVNCIDLVRVQILHTMTQKISYFYCKFFFHVAVSDTDCQFKWRM